MNPNLAAVARIKAMALAAADNPDAGVAASEETAGAYDRLRQLALELHARAGWGDEEAFSREVAPLTREATTSPGHIEGRIGRDRSQAIVREGQRARLLLRLLAAWAAGYQEAFEIEARFEAEARAKAAVPPPRRPAGFGGAD